MSASGSNPTPDVLIIGAGPTGAVAAKRFAEAGMSVVVLEQGDWPDYSKARAGHPDYKVTAGSYWAANPNRRKAPADYPISDTDSDIGAVLYNAVGGGTVIAPLICETGWHLLATATMGTDPVRSVHRRARAALRGTPRRGPAQPDGGSMNAINQHGERTPPACRLRRHAASFDTLDGRTRKRVRLRSRRRDALGCTRDACAPGTLTELHELRPERAHDAGRPG